MPLIALSYFFTYVYIIIFQTVFHYGLLQDNEYSSLCYIVGPFWLSILYIVVYIINSKFQIYTSPNPITLWKP